MNKELLKVLKQIAVGSATLAGGQLLINAGRRWGDKLLDKVEQLFGDTPAEGAEETADEKKEK